MGLFIKPIGTQIVGNTTVGGIEKCIPLTAFSFGAQVTQQGNGNTVGFPQMQFISCARNSDSSSFQLYTAMFAMKPIEEMTIIATKTVSPTQDQQPFIILTLTRVTMLSYQFGAQTSDNSASISDNFAMSFESAKHEWYDTVDNALVSGPSLNVSQKLSQLLTA